MKQEEWKMIYQMYQKPLFLYAFSFTKNLQDAEDLLQETFIKAFLSYQSTGSIKCWLITVLKHEFLNLCRKRKKEVLDNGEETLNNRPSEGKDILEYMVEQEERRRLFQAIQKLPIASKEILIESVYFHLQDGEIAQMHGISRENVRKIRSRAKAKLLTMLREEVE